MWQLLIKNQMITHSLLSNKGFLFGNYWKLLIISQSTNICVCSEGALFFKPFKWKQFQKTNWKYLQKGLQSDLVTKMLPFHLGKYWILSRSNNTDVQLVTNCFGYFNFSPFQVRLPQMMRPRCAFICYCDFQSCMKSLERNIAAANASIIICVYGMEGILQLSSLYSR